MKKLWENFQDWRERRRQKNFEWWERKRTQGKLRYVLWFTTVWGLTMIIVLSLSDFYFDGYVSTGTLWFRIIYFLIAGVVLGLLSWSTNERKYRSRKGMIDTGHHLK